MEHLFQLNLSGSAPKPPSHSAVRLLVLVPAFDPGPALVNTARALIASHPDVWVLVDGSADGSDDGLESLLDDPPGFRVLRRRSNLGKGATMLEGAQKADAEGFTHVLSFDSDGQHPPELVPEFRRQCEQCPNALIMGEPVFGPDAPLERVYFRRVANAVALIETFGRLRFDSLFGMRVYPLQAFLRAFSETRWGRRYDFDAEIAVRMVWSGVAVVGVRTPVRYPNKDAGGVSHFRYGRDNLALARMHARLLLEASARALRGEFRGTTAKVAPS
jgi:glycosyltransferase involved in cell wall biosynthesis